MENFLKLSQDEQQRTCAVAAEQLGLDAGSVEKDFWVCWTLRELFALPEIGPRLTFKGGTSLSKGWRIIERFSEDLDVVVDRKTFGSSADNAPEAPGITSKKREQRLDKLSADSRDYITTTILPALGERIRRIPNLAAERSLTIDGDDLDGQTLLFHYPRMEKAASYLRPVVKIEFGGRSDTDPTGTPMILPYLAETAPPLLRCEAFRIRTVMPERTFWEKAMLLHEEGYRAGGPSKKARLSRHYYDLYRLIRAGVGERAGGDLALFQRIVDHRSVFFRRGGDAQKTIKQGSLRIRPDTAATKVWKSDYEAMKDVMFWSEPPAFETILETVGTFENAFNRNEIKTAPPTSDAPPDAPHQA